MKTILVVTNKHDGKLKAFSVLSTVSKNLNIPYQTMANAMTNGRVYENESVKVERLDIVR